MNNEQKLVQKFESVSNITVKELTETFRKILGASGAIIKDKTLGNLKSYFPNAFKKGSRYSDTIADAVRMSILKDNVHYSTEKKAIVHIMGTRKSTSGTFRARFFEKTTGERKTKSGESRGRIEGLHFFRDAIAEAAPRAFADADARLKEMLSRIQNATQ